MPSPVAATRSYLICSTPRSGSTLLCEALHNTDLAGHPEEYFQHRRATGVPRRPLEYFEERDVPEVRRILGTYSRVDEELSLYDPRRFPDYRRYLNWVKAIGTTPNGVFGGKVMWGYFRGFIHRLRDLRPDDGYTGRALLGAEFPQLHYVWMSRRDKVRQAVSLWKALQTKAWHRKEGEPELRPGDLVFSFEAIDHLVAQLEEHDRGWEDFFVSNGILPHRVAYEDLVDSYEDTAIDIVRFLGVEVPDRVDFGERRMKQQADGFNEEWVGLYWETASPRQRVAES